MRPFSGFQELEASRVWKPCGQILPATFFRGPMPVPVPSPDSSSDSPDSSTLKVLPSILTGETVLCTGTHPVKTSVRPRKRSMRVEPYFTAIPPGISFQFHPWPPPRPCRRMVTGTRATRKPQRCRAPSSAESDRSAKPEKLATASIAEA